MGSVQHVPHQQLKYDGPHLYDQTMNADERSKSPGPTPTIWSEMQFSRTI
jgi:hypothetical protein